MKKLNQKGFGLWEFILLLLLLLLLFFIFWYVLQQNNKNEASDKPQSSAEVANNTDATKVAEKSYLKITEWGVRFELTESINDALYKINNGYVYMSTASYESHAECKKQLADLGDSYLYYQALSRLKGSDELDMNQQEDNVKTVEQAATKYPDNYIKIGDYYYNFSRGNGIECNPDDSKINDFQSAIKTLELIP